jgi:hypothetical protein
VWGLEVMVAVEQVLKPLALTRLAMDKLTKVGVAVVTQVVLLNLE